MADSFSTKCHLVRNSYMHIYRPIISHQEQSEVQFFIQKHFTMQTRGIGDQSNDLLIRGQPSLPLEPQPPSCLIMSSCLSVVSAPFFWIHYNAEDPCWKFSSVISTITICCFCCSLQIGLAVIFSLGLKALSSVTGVGLRTINLSLHVTLWVKQPFATVTGQESFELRNEMSLI